MKLDLYNQKAEKVGNIDANESIFGGKINDKVLAQYVYIYLSNQRESNAHTKDRSEVSGGGKKPWKQKGTGRARVGSNRSPIWKGGGVTFGPTNNVNWKRKTTRTFRQAAFRSALAKMNKAELVNLVDKFEIDEKKALTKQAMEMKKNFGEPKKMLIVTSEKNEALINAFANIGKSRVALVSEISVYDLLTGGKVLIEEKALEYINSKWSK